MYTLFKKCLYLIADASAFHRLYHPRTQPEPSLSHQLGSEVPQCGRTPNHFCHTTLLHCNLPSSHSKALSLYKPRWCRCAGAMEKLSALYRWGFDCCSSGSKTLERPPDLTWIHTQTHLALIWNYKSGQVLLETEPRFVWKACKPQPSFQQAAFSIWLWVSWQIFCRALVCDSFFFVAGLLCCGVVCHA